MNPEDLLSRIHYDPESGIFTWTKPLSNRNKVGDRAGGVIGNGYIALNTKSGIFYAHRLAWLIMTGDWPNGEVDHINMDKTDNRWCNLRDVAHDKNQWNRSKYKNNTSGQKGVTYNKQTGGWIGHVRFNWEVHSKHFMDYEKAVEWVRTTRECLHGENGRDS